MTAYDDATGNTLLTGDILKGNLTIGVGHNLSAKGLSPAIRQLLLEEDIQDVEDNLDERLPWWRNLSDNRQMAVADMCFNLGIGGLLEFPKFLAAMHAGNWSEAVQELKTSLWASQVKQRAIDIENLILGG
ncbi:MAG: glycoside hydrolase family protein [Patescibacteria group bacterium]|nr:glycoside hydrolase family protein [Patescibacteria group bacterium]